MRRLLLAALVLALPGASFASSDEKKKAEDGQYVPISPIAVPVMSGGKIANYIFVTVRVTLKPTANTMALREKEPYFRDALVRAAHRTPFTLASDFTKVDEAKLKAAVLRDAQAIGGTAVKGVELVNQTPMNPRAKGN